ncbi:MAG: hypothetical protein JW767_07010 [Thermoleophilia bacterium]|nr:hypothetical protein [Thermoleophilia bacterium]
MNGESGCPAAVHECAVRTIFEDEREHDSLKTAIDSIPGMLAMSAGTLRE